MILRGKKILQKIKRSYFCRVKQKNIILVKEIESFLVQALLILLDESVELNF